MRLFALINGLLLLSGSSVAVKKKASSTGASSPASTSGCKPTAADTSVIEFAWALQNLTDQWYSSSWLNSSAFSSAPNDSTAMWYPNFEGMKKASSLGLLAVNQTASRTPNVKQPRCNYTLPKATDSRSVLFTTRKLEASVCGAFIALAGYAESPEVSFLLARLAASHAAHATYIGGSLMEPIFSTKNDSLIAAYPPERVLSKGNATGMLGSFMGMCVNAPMKPCGKTLIVGPESGNLTSNASAISSALATETAAV